MAVLSSTTVHTAVSMLSHVGSTAEDAARSVGIRMMETMQTLWIFCEHSGKCSGAKMCGYGVTYKNPRPNMPQTNSF